MATLYGYDDDRRVDAAKVLKNPNLYARVAANNIHRHAPARSPSGNWRWTETELLAGQDTNPPAVPRSTRSRRLSMASRRLSMEQMQNSLREQFRLNGAKLETIQRERRELMLLAAEAEEREEAEAKAIADEQARKRKKRRPRTGTKPKRQSPDTQFDAYGIMKRQNWRVGEPKPKQHAMKTTPSFHRSKTSITRLPDTKFNVAMRRRRSQISSIRQVVNVASQGV